MKPLQESINFFLFWFPCMSDGVALQTRSTVQDDNTENKMIIINNQTKEKTIVDKWKPKQ